MGTRFMGTRFVSYLLILIFRPPNQTKKLAYWVDRLGKVNLLYIFCVRSFTFLNNSLPNVHVHARMLAHN